MQSLSGSLELLLICGILATGGSAASLPNYHDNVNATVVAYGGTQATLWCTFPDVESSPCGAEFCLGQSSNFIWRHVSNSSSSILESWKRDLKVGKGRYRQVSEKLRLGLKIQNVTQADAGIYSCTHVHGYGANAQRIRLIVKQTLSPFSTFHTTVTAQTTQTQSPRRLIHNRQKLHKYVKEQCGFLKYRKDGVTKIQQHTFSELKQDQVDVIDDKYLILSNLFLTQMWYTDCKWDPKDFGEILEIVIKSEKIWVPELRVISGEQFAEPKSYDVILRYSGYAEWSPKMTFKQLCTDLLDKSKDVECSITLDPWYYQKSDIAYNGSHVDQLFSMDNSENNNNCTNGIRAGDWIVLSSRASVKKIFYECCPDAPYQSIDITTILGHRARCEKREEKEKDKDGTISPKTDGWQKLFSFGVFRED